MYISWLGHSCFAVEEEGYRVIIDPYTRVPGYPPLQVQAHNLLCSHSHFDHAHHEAVTLLPPLPCPFTIRTVASFHDEEGGALRGENTIDILSAGGVTLVHLGDLGQELTAEQCREIGPCDLLMVPVGGRYTLDAAAAFAAVEALKPRLVVPMHYRHGGYGLEDIAGVEDVLALFPENRCQRLRDNSFLLTPEDGKRGLLLPCYPV